MFLQQKSRIVGIVMMFLAIYLLLNGVVFNFFRYFFDSEIFYYLINVMPNLLVAIFLFIFGYNLIKKKKDIDVLEYKEIPQDTNVKDNDIL